MRLRDIKDPSDLRDLSANDARDVLDELRVIAAKRGAELLRLGGVQARRAIGAPDRSAVGWALVLGVAVGAVVGAVVAVLMAPLPGRETRMRLARQAEEMKGRMEAKRAVSNGRQAYPVEEMPPMPSTTARPMV